MLKICRNRSWRPMCIFMAVSMIIFSVTACEKQGSEGASTTSTISPPAGSSGPDVVTPADETEAGVPSVALKLVRADGTEIDFSSKPIPLTVSVKAVFSEAMDKQSVESAVSLTDPQGKPVDGAFSWSADDKELRFAPKKALAPATTYAFHASADALSSAATPIEAIELSFLTMTKGDVNGDGFTDFLVGSPGYNSNKGAAVLYSSQLDMNDKISSKPITTIVGEKALEGFGKAVAIAGDLDGDGFADIVIGAPATEDSNNAEVGAVYFFSGRNFSGREKAVAAITPIVEANAVIYGKIDNDGFGASLLGIGDIEGDGFGEFLVGSPQLLVKNRIFVFGGKKFANMTILTTDDALAIILGEDKSMLGNAMATAGDVDGDGINEIIISAMWKAKVYIFKVSTLKDDVDLSAAMCTIKGNAITLFGKSVARAGDLNGDGFDDVIIGAPGFMGPFSKGAALVFSGKKVSSSAELDAADSMASYQGQNELDWMGFSVAGGMDLNGDGTRDIMISVPGYPGTALNGKGRILGYSGSHLSSWPILTKDGVSAGDRFGSAVATLGDLTGKGKDVVIVSAPGFNNSTGYLKIFVPGAISTLNGTDTGDQFGEVVSTDVQ